MATAQYIAETIGLLAVSALFAFLGGWILVRMVFPNRSEDEPFERETDWGSQ